MRCSDNSVSMHACLLDFGQREKKLQKKESIIDTVTVTGPVTKLKSHLTVLFRIGENTVARRSEKHLKTTEGKDVSAECVVKKDRIIRIKSVTVLGVTADPIETGQISFRQLSRFRKDDPENHQKI